MCDKSLNSKTQWHMFAGLMGITGLTGMSPCLQTSSHYPPASTLYLQPPVWDVEAAKFKMLTQRCLLAHLPRD